MKITNSPTFSWGELILIGIGAFAIGIFIPIIFVTVWNFIELIVYVSQLP